MLIPNNKKYLVYIKTAKTGGTSFVNILEQICNLKNRKLISYNNLDNVTKNDIIMIVNDQILFFVKNYPHIYNNSYLIFISRNPYDRLISGWKYHPNTQNKTLEELFNNPKYPPISPFLSRWKDNYPKNIWYLFSVYNHLYCKQTEYLTINNKFIINYVLKFENLNNDIFNLLNLLNIDISQINIPHLNKGTNYITNSYNKYLKNQELLNNINNYFKEDFDILNYIMLKN